MSTHLKLRSLAWLLCFCMLTGRYSYGNGSNGNRRAAPDGPGSRIGNFKTVTEGSEPSFHASPGTPQSSTIVNLVSNAGNAVQLGIEVNGVFSYPFTFTADPSPTNGISLSPSGLITGTPAPGADQTITITVLDDAGKTIAQYPVVFHVGAATVVRLGTASGGSPATKTKRMPPPEGIAVNPLFVSGDTISGSLFSSTNSSRPAKQESGSGTPSHSSSGLSDSSSSDGQAVSTANLSSSADPSDSTASSGNTDSLAKNAIVLVRRNDEQEQTVTTDAKGAFSYQFNTPIQSSDKITVLTGAGDHVIETPVAVLNPPPQFKGEDMRAVVGYQQTGASSSPFTQDWFLDFYINRPLKFCKQRKLGQKTPAGTQSQAEHATESAYDCSLAPDFDLGAPRWRWWGNVRVASYPQPGNQSVADLATGFATQLGSVKLNQLAQGAEFLTGIEYDFLKSIAFRGFSENTRQRFYLGFIAGVGATGFFDAPSKNVQVFQVPAVGSPQSTAFMKAYPGIASANVGFISPDVERFPKQYLAGLRLTTRYVSPSGMPLTSAPAMLALTVGQNQVITGNQLRGVVGRIEAFYPLPFGNRSESTLAGAFSSLYLFGNTEMKLGSSKSLPNLVLQPVTTAAFDSSVTLVSAPNTRDLYRIGFGVDLVSFLAHLTGGSAGKSTTAAASPK
jgi:hypothetical protein